jgi:hypothetical protein
MVEKELGERNFGFDSLKSRLKRDIEEYIPNTEYCRIRTPRGAAPPPPEDSAYEERSAHTMERRRNDMDPK